MSATASGFRPVPDGESGNATELALVVGDQRRSDVSGVGGNQQIVRPDHGARALERDPNLAVVRSGGHGEVVELEELEKLGERVLTLFADVAAGDTVLDLGDRDRGE